MDNYLLLAVRVAIITISLFAILKFKLLTKFKLLLNKLFWLDSIDAGADSRKKGLVSALKFLIKFMIAFYIICILMGCLHFIMYLNFSLILPLIIVVIFYPLLCRVLIGFQIKFHKIKMQSK